VLVDRFLANDDFAARYAEATTRLTATLFASGTAKAALDDWAAVLTEQAGDLVPAATIAEEAAALESSVG
jgi:spore coat protein CotH